MRFAASTLFAGLAAASVYQSAPPQGPPKGSQSAPGMPSASLPPKESPPVSSKQAPELTTSTIYSTQYHTVTSCASTVTNCPAHSTVVVTDIIAVSTTVCPVEQAQPTGASSKPAAPVVSSKPAAPVNAQSTCNAVTETCTVTVTLPLSASPYPNKNNATTAQAKATGTGTPVKPAAAYYSNSASSLAGGAFAIGAGLLAAIAL